MALFVISCKQMETVLLGERLSICILNLAQSLSLFTDEYIRSPEMLISQTGNVRAVLACHFVWQTWRLVHLELEVLDRDFLSWQA